MLSVQQVSEDWRGGDKVRRQGPVLDSLSVCITDWALIKSEAPIPALSPILYKEESEKEWRSGS